MARVTHVFAQATTTTIGIACRVGRSKREDVATVAASIRSAPNIGIDATKSLFPPIAWGSVGEGRKASEKQA